MCTETGIGYRCTFFFFQAEDGIRDLVRSRGLGDVYKRQFILIAQAQRPEEVEQEVGVGPVHDNLRVAALCEDLSLIHI